MCSEEELDGFIVFESDADLDWWLNALDSEIVFEPEEPTE